MTENLQHKYADCEHNQGFCVDEACEGELDNCRAEEQLIADAKALCVKFINKVETGRARSTETLAECKALLAKIEKLEAS